MLRKHQKKLYAMTENVQNFHHAGREGVSSFIHVGKKQPRYLQTYLKALNME